MFLGYMVLKPKQVCDAMHCGKPAVWREAWDDDLPFPTNYWCDEHKPKVTRL